MCNEEEAAQLATAQAKIAWIEKYGGTVTPEMVRRLVVGPPVEPEPKRDDKDKQS